MRPFSQRTLDKLLNCSRELRLLGEVVTKFGHAVREFRNYIHPQRQVAENFRPRKAAVQVARHMLRVAIGDLGTHTRRPTARCGLQDVVDTKVRIAADKFFPQAVD